MKKGLALMIAAWALPAGASTMTLQDYLAQVKSRNPEAIAAEKAISAYKNRLEEGDYQLSPEAYLTYNILDDKKENAQPQFQGDRLKTSVWTFGIKKQTEWGLAGNLYFNSQRTNLHGVDPTFFPINDYLESKAALELRQSLWQNGFGEATRAQIAGQNAANRAQLLQNEFNLKMLLLKAENTYWGVVSFKQILKLQTENVDRAKQLWSRMQKRAKMGLFDDVDALQSQVAYESRQMDLEASQDQLASLVRELNTIRGRDSEQVEDLTDLPAGDMMAKFTLRSGGRMAREDFEMLRAQAIGVESQAKASRSMIRPKFDLTAQLATSGRDAQTQASYEELEKGTHPTWAVGVEFSVPLDFGLTGKLRRSYAAAVETATATKERADFQEKRMWKDLVDQRSEAQGRYERALKIESLQTDLVKRERRRLANGRATTFEALNIEQNLALAQVQRVRAQLDLLQAHNVLKTFEEKQ